MRTNTADSPSHSVQPLTVGFCVNRDEVAPRWLIEAMVAELGAKKTAALLQNKISASTLGRKYAAQS